MKKLTETEQKEMLKCMLLGSIISADNDKYSEDLKQEVMKRMEASPNDIQYILEPLGEESEKYIKLLAA